MVSLSPPPARARPARRVPPPDTSVPLPLFTWSASRSGPGEVHYRAPVHVATVPFTAHPRSAMRVGSDRPRDLDKQPGAAWLVPSGTEFWTGWREDAEYGQLVIAPATFADLSADLLDGQVRPASALLGVDEPQLARIFQLVRDELEAGLPTGALYLEGLGLAAVARLVTGKAAIRARSPVRGGLSPGALRRVQSLVRDGDDPSGLSLSAMASAAGLSRFHFLRAFRASTGLTPAQYVMRERVSRAESLLRGTRLPIAEICRIVGFGSLDQLYRAFSTVKGQTPGSFRREGAARGPLPPSAS